MKHFSKIDKRMREIQEILTKQGKVKVNDIAAMFNVSEMTARRDLKKLEEEGFIKRTLWGAIFLGNFEIMDKPYIINNEINRNIDQKNRIGEKAASFIKPMETVFFDSGSTVPFVEKFIDRNLSFTAVCYSFKSAIGFYKRKNVKLILSGGLLEHDSNIFRSEDSASFIRKFRADKVFLSAGGVHLDMGITTYFYYEVEIKKAMIKSAKNRILLADSSKFGKISTTFFANIEEINTVITDDGIPDEYREIIESKGINLYIAWSYKR